MVPTQPLPQDQPEATCSRKISDNTERKTKSDIQVMKDHLKAAGETRNLELIPINELDIHFGNFLLNVRRKHDGSLYSASSLIGFVHSFNRYLRDKKYRHQVCKGSEFRYTQSVLNQKLAELKGLDLRKVEDSKLTSNDVEKLFEIGEIGLHSPKALMQFMYVSVIRGLGIRRGMALYNLKWGDIVLCVMDNGAEFLTHVKFVNPSMDSETSDLLIMFETKPKILGNVNKNRCPIEAYKLYASKRPITMNDPDSPFLLSGVSKLPKFGGAWFLGRCIGRNMAASLMKELIRKSRSALQSKQ